MNNDDGFGSANIRETYHLLKAAGHDVLIVAPVYNESGQGGRSAYRNLPELTVPSEFDLVPAGSPALGKDPHDSNIWYYNCTPAACTFVALDYVIPNYWENRKVDLFAAGPNLATISVPSYTLSPGSWVLRTRLLAVVCRALPSLAATASSAPTNKTTESGKPDPATILAQLAVDIVQQLVNNTKEGERISPLGYGINVNNPVITSLTNPSCVAPPFVQTRLTGGAFTDSAVYNATKGTFRYGDSAGIGVNRCINDNCALPGETDAVDDGCYSSVSLFTADYDGPRGPDQAGVRSALSPLVLYESPSKIARAVKRTAAELEERAPLRRE